MSECVRERVSVRERERGGRGERQIETERETERDACSNKYICTTSEQNLHILKRKVFDHLLL